MKLSAIGGQAKPVAVTSTGVNPWKFSKEIAGDECGGKNYGIETAVA